MVVYLYGPPMNKLFNDGYNFINIWWFTSNFICDDAQFETTSCIYLRCRRRWQQMRNKETDGAPQRPAAGPVDWGARKCWLWWLTWY